MHKILFRQNMSLIIQLIKIFSINKIHKKILFLETIALILLQKLENNLRQ